MGVCRPSQRRGSGMNDTEYSPLTRIRCDVKHMMVAQSRSTTAGWALCHSTARQLCMKGIMHIGSHQRGNVAGRRSQPKDAQMEWGCRRRVPLPAIVYSAVSPAGASVYLSVKQG
ncbi:hypothetical protein KIL84_021555 [Mauremys mutica]|uniref:Uncharacterized protein n=1 Tax=Mauremys mutica TaxID=74926 RepID=A0A9D4B002_9SAUR|nr:hypothetical protein KIL84_021555 [Mauremys mutica]